MPTDNTIAPGTSSIESHQIWLLLGRMESKLDAYLQRAEMHEAKTEDLDTRLSTIEKAQSYVYGAVGTIGTLFAFLELLPTLKELLK